MTREEAITILKDFSWQMGSVKRWENIEAIDMAIEALSAEAVEVVRCRECKWHRSGQNEVDTWSICIEPTLRAAHVQDDDYCSWGERKEAADDYH